MTKRAWKTKIKKACTDAGTYRPYFNHVIDTLADILSRRDKIQEEYIAAGVEWVLSDSCEVTGKGTADLVSQKDIDVRETEGQIIKARVKNVYDGQSFTGNQIRPALSIVGKQIHYFEGKMVNDSIAVFYTFGIHGNQPLVLSAMTSTGVSLPIDMISPFATLLPKQLPHLVFHYKRSEVEARSLDMQRHQIAITPAKRELKLGDDAESGTFGFFPRSIVYSSQRTACNRL